MLLVSQSFNPCLFSPCPSNLCLSQLPNSFFNYTSVHSLGLNKRRVARYIVEDDDNRRVCHAGLAQDAPFVAAIGACILNSLAFPVYAEKEDNDGDELIDSMDVRLSVMGFISFIPYFNWLSWVFALVDSRKQRYIVYSIVYSMDGRLSVMGFISFIPYFNWLSWVFALVDSGKQRYIAYSIVYLAPYFRTNLSLSPEESWVPIASILLSIIHVQLEISIMNGDITGIFPGSSSRRWNSRVEGRRSHRNELPSTKDEPRDTIRGWKVEQKSADILRKLKRKEDADEENRKSD